MAEVDFREYSRQAGATLDTRSFESGIDSFMKNRKEAIVNKATNLGQNTWSSHMMPWENFKDTDVADWDISTLPTMSAGQALEAYKQSAKSQGNKVYNQLLNQGEFDPLNFKKKYDSIKMEYMPAIERKLENYQTINRLSDKEMSKFIKDKGMQNFLLSYGEDAGIAREWATPERTWKEWAEDKGGILGIGAKTGLGTLGVYGGQRLARGIYDRFQNPNQMTSAQSKAMAESLGETEYGKKITGKENLKVGQAVSSAKGDVTRATKKLEKSEKLLEEAKAKFKKSGAKGKFVADDKLLKEIASNKTSLGKAKEALKVAENVTPKGLKPLVDRVVRKYGKSGAMRKVMAKLGPRASISLLAKLGLGALPTGVTQVASASLLAADVYMVYNILQELAE